MAPMQASVSGNALWRSSRFVRKIFVEQAWVPHRLEKAESTHGTGGLSMRIAPKTVAQFGLLLAMVLATTIISPSPCVAEGVPVDDSVKSDSAAVEYFEKRVRPILVERCLGCHGPTKHKGGLRLDSARALAAGGSNGPAVVPGDPGKSLLIDAINYGDLVQMPPRSKLPMDEIATLTQWVEQGARWGLDERPSGADHGAKPGASLDLQASGEFERRAAFWSFQPVRKIDPPEISERFRCWPRNAIDRFLLVEMARRGLSPAPEADRRTLIRRLCFDLTGLPPTPEEAAAFVQDPAPDAYERLVDRLLASPHHGERWGRHWLDLVRFAETSGHEFDYEILNAHRYRDYVIRAINQDLPYDRFVIEQLAGDLLLDPRRNPIDGSNESILGTGFFFLGEGTHSPVDVREEQMRRIDNQIDVLSKAFLGLTVSCARCHDHKFDPISTRDYYALAGFLKSSRHQQAFVDDPATVRRLVQGLERLKGRVRECLGGLFPRVDASSGASGDAFEMFDHDSFDGWSVTGDAFGTHPTRPGDFRLDLKSSPPTLTPIRPGQAHSALASERLQGVLRSRTFTIERRFIHSLVSGNRGRINVVVDGFEKIRDPIYGGLTVTVHGGDEPRWVTQDVSMWVGHRAYLELGDGATADYTGGQTHLADGEGWLAVDEIVFSDDPRQPSLPVFSPSLNIEEAVKRLRRERPDSALELEAVLAEYRDLEARLPRPTLALAIADGTGENEYVLIRGNHRTPGEPVPRRFLQVLTGGDQGSPGAESGRLDLARSLVDPRGNPLFARVMVNRLWKHHFGEGIVRSTDDLGAMGQMPSHPELLDWLAANFEASGWSLKAMHRLMVTSSAYRMTSSPRVEEEKLDPTNVSLHRMNIRRLESEAVRDALLAVSGQLDRTMFGRGVAPHLSSFMQGRGRPSRSGPLDGDGRRSVYLNVRRNFLDPMLQAFDAPVPFSTMGRRNVSNVPAQALALLNDPLLIHLADCWASRVLSGPARSDRERVEELYQEAFARSPSQNESRACVAFLEQTNAASERERWADLCHVLMNVKEFIYIP
jgi:hypothetical protein